MNFNCETSLLLEAISNVSKATTTKSNIPALEGIKFSYSDHIIEVTGYDLELGMTTTVPVLSDSTENFEFIINAKIILDILRKLRNETIEFKIDENMNCQILSGIVDINIKILDTKEYPVLPFFDSENAVTLPQAILKSMISQTAFAVATNDQKPILTGHLIDIKDGIFNMTAIDNVRMALRTEEIKSEIECKIVVPAKAMSAVSHILKDDNEKDVEISSNKKHIMFKFNGYTIFSRLLEGEYNNYKSLIPTDYQTEVIISVDEFMKALDMTTIFIEENIRNYVKCTFEDDAVDIDFKSNKGSSKVKVGINLSGSPITLGFNPKFMIDALKVADSDKVVIKLNSPVKPFVVKPIQGDSFTFLIMPVNLK